MAALSVVARPKCGQGSRATTPARSSFDRQVRLDLNSDQWAARRMITDTARVAVAATYAPVAAHLSSRRPTNMEARAIQGEVWSRSSSRLGVWAVVGTSWCLLPARTRLAASEPCPERD